MGKSFGGARAKILVRGIEVGYATGVSGNEMIAQVPVDVLGDAYTKEHELVGITVSMSADFVRMRQESLVQQGLWPSGDTADLLAFNDAPMTWDVYDQSTDKIVERIEGVVCESRGWRVDRGSVMMTNASFRGIRMTDDTPGT